MKQLFFLQFMMLCIQLTAQETIPAAGGNASGSGGSASYTIGQVVYQTNAGITGTVAQCVQQPYEISVATALEEAKGMSLIVSVYPNPTIDNLTLEIIDYNLSSLTFQLFDARGMLLQSDKIKSKETSINTINLLPSTYFVKINQSNKELKTFKIIKK